jgi:hypothetical protein
MGVIQQRTTLAFPGGLAAQNRLHPMALGARYAGVASPGGGFIDLLTGKPSVPTNGTPTTTVLSGSGPGVPTNTSTVYNAIANSYSDSPSSVTMAAILTITASPPGNPAVIFSTRSTITGASGIFWGLAGIFNCFANGAGVLLGASFILTVGQAYFVASSFRNGLQNFVAINLKTGRILTTTGTSAMTMTVGTGSYAIGVATAGQHPNASISAVAYSINNFMSLERLLQWARAPWDYWYPPVMGDLMSSALIGSSGITGASQARVIMLA